jgi:hypothetical protein
VNVVHVLLQALNVTRHVATYTTQGNEARHREDTDHAA